MKSRGLMALVIASMLGLFSTFAFAEKAAAKAGQAKKVKNTKVENKTTEKSPMSLSLYSKGSYYMVGAFWDPYFSDRLVRSGLSLGVGCHYTGKYFRIGAGRELYKGTFAIGHEEPLLNGSFYFDEVGVKTWINTALILNGIEIGFTAGVEKTDTSALKINDLYIDLGSGWLNLKSFAAETLLSKVDFTIWEAGLDTVFPLNRNFSLTFGLLWQQYDANMHIDFDMYGQGVLQYFNYSLDNKKEVDISQSLFYLTPGIKWCKGKKVCASVVIPWGIFNSDAWSLGGVAGVEYTF